MQYQHLLKLETTEMHYPYVELALEEIKLIEMN